MPDIEFLDLQGFKIDHKSRSDIGGGCEGRLTFLLGKSPIKMSTSPHQPLLMSLLDPQYIDEGVYS